MNHHFMHDALIRQERRAATLFVVLFYSIYFIYDIAFYYLLPWFNSANAEVGYPMPIVTFFVYAFFIGLIPLTVYLIRNRKPGPIKYVYFISYIVMTTASNVIVYSDESYVFRDGNIVEIFFLLFSPIFVNKRFFWVVALGMLARYAVTGLLLHISVVMVPILLVLLLSAIAYVILNRFLGYVQAIQDTYNSHMEGIVKGIIATLELKDPYTKGHSERVARYSLLLARQAGISGEHELKSFYYSCLLHDVGKVHMPDSILLKSAALTPEEYEAIKTHPVVGADAIQDIKGLEYCVDVVRHHHERWDGKGYPDGLQGERIPLLARIVAVADAFDAMTSLRSYRPAMAPDEAYRQIVSAGGSQFDPGIVKHFKAVYPEIEASLRAGPTDEPEAEAQAAAGKEVEKE